MPSAVIHEKVGYNLGKKFSLNSYAYYLGLLAPDAPNLNGFAPKKDRWQAHIRRENLKEWNTALLKFYLKNKENYPKDFLLGYYIHILTDIIFDEYIYLNIRTEIELQGYKENAHQIMSNDMESYYFIEFEDIKRILKKNQTSYNINNISKELLNAWKEKIISSSKRNNQVKFVTEKVIENLTEMVAKRLVESNIL